MNGTIRNTAAVGGKLSAAVPLSGKVGAGGASSGGTSPAEVPAYTGAYTVTPLADRDTVLSTAGKRMTADVTVGKIPYREVTGPSGGTTLIIAQEQ